MEAADLLCTDVDCIRNGNLMAVCDAVCSMECKGSYGTAFFDHLAADGASLAGGQVTVVTVGQVHANLGSSLHLELVHSFTSLGNVDLIVALHIHALLLLSSEQTLSEESVFCFRRGSFARKVHNMNVSCRKNTKFLETKTRITAA